MRSGRVEKGRSNTPNQPEWSRMFGREKETLSGVAQAILGTILRLQWRILRQVLDVEEVMLRNHWEDRAQNKVPIFVNRNGNDRLNIERELVAVVRRPVAEVLVGLERDANQRRDGVRQLFGELVCLVRVRFHLGSIGSVESLSRQKKGGEDRARREECC